MATGEMQIKVEKKREEEEERTHADTYIVVNQSVNAKKDRHASEEYTPYMGFHQTAA